MNLKTALISAAGLIVAWLGYEIIRGVILYRAGRKMAEMETRQNQQPARRWNDGQTVTGGNVRIPLLIEKLRSHLPGGIDFQSGAAHPGEKVFRIYDGKTGNPESSLCAYLGYNNQPGKV